MSQIIEKVFDSSKKIIRAIFRGSPNLFTTDDLNRQIQAIKFQLDQLDDKTGMVSDCTVSTSLSGGTLSITINYSYLMFKGCSFTPTNKSLTINLTKSSPTAYVCLVAEKKTVSYSNDSSHSISGAVFSDGTSKPSADHEVYYGESFIVSHSLSTISNLVGIVAYISLSDSGNVITKINSIDKQSSLKIGSSETLSDLTGTTGKLTIGDTYSEAFSKLDNRFFLSKDSDWKELTNEDSKALNSESALARAVVAVKGSLLCLSVQGISYTINTASRYPPIFQHIFSFDDETKAMLVSYYKNTLYPQFFLNETTQRPTGDGSAMIKVLNVGAFHSPTTNEDLNGTAVFGLIGSYESGVLAKVFLGFSIAALKENIVGGAVTSYIGSQLNGARVCFQPISTSIPLLR